MGFAKQRSLRQRTWDGLGTVVRFIMDVDAILKFLKGLFEIADYLVFKVGFLILAILGVKALIRHHRKTTL